MVKSLRQTPYRPSMAVLGSRDRMCIHSFRTEPGGEGKNVTAECRSRTKNTQQQRKFMLESNDPDLRYYDEDPPSGLVSDDAIIDGDDDQDKTKPTCPHYRQLTADRTARGMLERLRPPASSMTTGSTSCCSSQGDSGADETVKAGSHDIEDLIEFGKNPEKRTVRMKRHRKTGADDAGVQEWGIRLTTLPASPYPVVAELVPGGRFAQASGMKAGEFVFSLNGVDLVGRSPEDVQNEIDNTSGELVIQVGLSEEEVSLHSACPYYMSRTLEKHAELVFSPYQYVLDRNIRKALNIVLDDTVVVLDEAHNVEGTLRESGSGEWSEFVICEMIVALQQYSGMDGLKYSPEYDAEKPPEERTTVNEMAHTLLCFLEKMLLSMLDAKRQFEMNQAKKILQEAERFHTPDDTDFEMTYDGPTGIGRSGKPVGCKPFFEKHSLNQAPGETLIAYAEEVQSFVLKQDDHISNTFSSIMEKILDVISKLAIAMDQPQYVLFHLLDAILRSAARVSHFSSLFSFRHYFIQTKVKPNGSFNFASGSLLSSDRGSNRRREPRSLPFAPGRSSTAPNLTVESCRFCRPDNSDVQRHDLVFINGRVKHASYANGSKPAWEGVLVLDLLSPAPFMKDLTRSCRSIILASGSLAPLPSLCGELGLHAGDHSGSKPSTPSTTSVQAKSSPSASSEVSSSEMLTGGRLQLQPPPLEANHVVNLDKQLLAIAVGHFPRNGEKITVTHSNYKKDRFITSLGDAIATIVESVPRGGVLVFLPSYSLLRRCTKLWRPSRYHDEDANTWERLEYSKGTVIVEPTGSQVEFEAARDSYAAAIRETGNACLLAVFRGKMSEGISFNDDNARAVICVGVPYPSSFDRAIKAKKCYNDEQRKFAQQNNLLPGQMWYMQQAFRAVSQALGRCIRHKGDFGVICLLDSRYCDEFPPDSSGTCESHKELPKWMRSHVKSLSMRDADNTDAYGKLVCGGWDGLRTRLVSTLLSDRPPFSHCISQNFPYHSFRRHPQSEFFDQAPSFTDEVLRKQQEGLEKARDRARQMASTLRFDRRAGQWAKSKPEKEEETKEPAAVVGGTPTSPVENDGN